MENSRGERGFLCDTLGVHIESRVHELVPNSRMGRFGDGTAMDEYHTFVLLKTDQGCDIVREDFSQVARRSRIRQQAAERYA
jgi:hypothetical protein